MTTIGDLADVVRSKNAGPFQITIDLMFNDRAAYERVRNSGRIAASVIAPLYQVDHALVRIMPFDRVRAIKITIPRTSGKHGSGSAFDRDVYGAQHHGPLAGIEIP
ncbi:MAG TPA: DUF4387 domain-containing protein [Casimicrobiaceae bacterium]|nr:DUF4387 domain-containing protein [Casimicrobiaceae bacterium]